MLNPTEISIPQGFTIIIITVAIFKIYVILLQNIEDSVKLYYQNQFC